MRQRPGLRAPAPSRHQERLLLLERFRLLFALLAIFAAMFDSRMASAQVPLVPDAIATPDLQPIIETLGLSDQQALTLLPIHDAYKDRYRTFLDTDVKELQDELVEIGLRFTRGAFEIPPRRDLEAIVSKFKRLLDKSRSLDRSFFTDIGGMLAQEQIPLLERARINRELKVFRQILGGVGEMNRGAGVNLGEMTRGLDLSPQEREQVEPVLAEYESLLLSKSNTIYNVLTDAAKVVLDFIDESGIRNMTLEQMAAMAQNPPPGLLDRAQSTFDLASKPIQEAAWDVSQMNMRTYRRIAPLLSEPNGRDLRDRYFRRAYREIYSGDSKWEARYRAALRLEELDDEQRAAIEEQRHAFVSQFDAAIDSGVAALEASRQYKTFRQFSQQDADPAAEKVDETIERRGNIEQQATNSLHAILGETLVATLDERLKKEPDLARDDRRIRVSARTRAPRGAAGGEAGDGSGAARVEVAGRTTPIPAPGAEPAETEESRYLPPAMNIKQFEQAIAALGLGEDDRSVATTLFDAYRAEYTTLRAAELEIKKEGEEPTPAENSKAIATRHEQLTGLDAALFDDLALLVHDDAAKATLQTFRLTRQRQAATDSSKTLAQSFGDDEAYIDLVTLLGSSDVPAPDRDRAIASLAEYDARIAPHVAKRLENAREVQRRFDSFQRSGRSRPTPGGNAESYNKAMEFAMEKWRESRTALRQTNDKILAVNRELLEQLVATLSSDAAWQLKLAYNEAAYPEIFGDDRSAEKSIQGALMLPDLEDSQRDRINELAAQFRADFYALCEQMVGLRQQREIDFMGGQMPKKEDIDREIELEKMRWNRNELSARARLQLSLILTDDQAKSLPELKSR